MSERYRVDSRRVRLLHDGIRGDGPVVYWLSRDQRVNDNWALLHAQDLAIRDMRELHVVFCLQKAFLNAGDRHFSFMLNGLKEMAECLAEHNIGFLVLDGEPQQKLPAYLSRVEAHSLITDFNPLRIKQRWQQQVADVVKVPFLEVDAHNIIPCWHASEKREYAAYTFRPKVNRLLPEFLIDFPEVRRHPVPLERKVMPVDWGVISIDSLAESTGNPNWPIPGEQRAKRKMDRFVTEKLCDYDGKRNDPLEDAQSGLSPYFHFGQLAPQRAALAVAKAIDVQAGKESFLEELIVRRELSDNFCYYCNDYDSFDGFPDWAKKSLEIHRADLRQYVYSEEQFLSSLTHEPLWNCCQKMLVESGRLHGYLRMYWAKKILEWSESPEEALRIAILLNDMFAFDGRDPNGYTGIAWSIGGVHDRAWREREIFGKVRYMNENGCRRKFDVNRLLAKTGLTDRLE